VPLALPVFVVSEFVLSESSFLRSAWERRPGRSASATQARRGVL